MAVGTVKGDCPWRCPLKCLFSEPLLHVDVRVREGQGGLQCWGKFNSN